MLTNNLPRSDIFRRAWQIKRRAPGNSFGECLRKAWNEARNLQFADWSHLPADIRFPVQQKTVDQLEMEILMLNMKDGWNDRDFETMRRLQRELCEVAA